MQVMFLFKVFLSASSCLQLEEEEAKDSFDVDVTVTNPEKVGQSFYSFSQFNMQVLVHSEKNHTSVTVTGVISTFTLFRKCAKMFDI